MATRILVERVDREADERKEAGAQLVRRASAIARRIFNLRRGKWRAAQEQWQQVAEQSVESIERQAETALASIADTEKAYREFMKLKAPVEYWENKAGDHKAREDQARLRLYWYFPVTLITLIAAFVAAGAFLLSSPEAQPGNAPLALYFVISGGLLLISTIGFWIGRLLTKLYLSEHHLRNDAEERATMTTTYLALTTEGAAAEADRHIVLNALFRATPDGIVREDGPTDASVHSFISKLVSR